MAASSTPTASNARLGAGDWMVVEADESDGTFLKLPADIAIVTNVDPEHLDHFQDLRRRCRMPSALLSKIFHSTALPLCAPIIPWCRLWSGRLEDRRIHHLRRKSASRYSSCRSGSSQWCVGSKFTVLFRDRARQDHPHYRHRLHHAADAGTPQRLSMPPPPLRWRMSLAFQGRCMIRKSLARFRRRQAALHQESASGTVPSPSSMTTVIIRWKSPQC